MVKTKSNVLQVELIAMDVHVSVNIILSLNAPVSDTRCRHFYLVRSKHTVNPSLPPLPGLDFALEILLLTHLVYLLKHHHPSRYMSFQHACCSWQANCSGSCWYAVQDYPHESIQHKCTCADALVSSDGHQV